MHHSVVHVCAHQLNVSFCLTVQFLHACGQQLLVFFFVFMAPLHSRAFGRPCCACRSRACAVTTWSYKHHENLTMTTATRIVTPGGPFPVNVGALQTSRPHGGRPKVMTITQGRDIRNPIPVTVGTFETRRKHEERKVTTGTRMAAFRRQKRRQLRGSQPRGAPCL